MSALITILYLHPLLIALSSYGALVLVSTRFIVFQSLKIYKHMDNPHLSTVALMELATDLDFKTVRLDLEELFALSYCSAALSDHSVEDRVSMYRSYTALLGILEQLELDFRQAKA